MNLTGQRDPPNLKMDINKENELKFITQPCISQFRYWYNRRIKKKRNFSKIDERSTTIKLTCSRNHITAKSSHKKTSKNSLSQLVRSMMAVTMSPSAVFNALTALDLETPACVITNSMSLGSTPVSSTSSSS